MAVSDVGEDVVPPRGVLHLVKMLRVNVLHKLSDMGKTVNEFFCQTKLEVR